MNSNEHDNVGRIGYLLSLKSSSTGIWKTWNYEGDEKFADPLIYLKGEVIADTWDEFNRWLDETPNLCSIHLSFTRYETDLDNIDELVDSCVTDLDEMDKLSARFVTFSDSGKMCFPAFSCDIKLKPYSPAFYSSLTPPSFSFKFICTRLTNELQIFHNILEKRGVKVWVPLNAQYIAPPFDTVQVVG